MKKALSILLVISMVLCSSGVTVLASSTEAQIISPIAEDDWYDPYKPLTVTWSTPESGQTYKITVKNEVTNSYYVQNKVVSGNSYTIPSNTLGFEQRYKIWVGTFNGSTALGGGDYIIARTYAHKDSSKVYNEAEFSYPQNNATIDPNSNLTIRYSGNSDLAYNLSIKDETTGEQIVNKTGLTQTSYTVSSSLLTAGHSYKAWIGTYKKDSYEQQLIGSGKYLYFTAEENSVNPGAFNIISPSNGTAFNYNSSVTIKWSAASNAVEYELYMNDISVENSSSNVLYKGADTSYTIPSSKLEGGHEYKIHVKARSKKSSDEGITWSSNSDENNEYTFYIKLNTPQITNPTNGGTLLLTSAIKWNSVSDASMYGLLLKDNVTGNELLESNGYPGYFLSSGETYCYLSSITWGDFSTDKLIANRSYTLTLRAYGEKSGYYTESAPVVFTFVEPSNPIVNNYALNSVTSNSFKVMAEILTTSSSPLSDITDCGFYYRKTTSSTPLKISLGEPSDEIFSTTITDLEPNTEYTYAAYAKNATGEGVSPWSTVTTSEEVVEPENYVLSVSPTTGKAKNVYTFSMDVDTLPDNAYLQFDNPQTGEWFDETYAASAWAFDWQDYVIKSGGFTLTKELNIATPGNADNNYKRKARVIYYYDGVAKITDPIEFTVKPNDEEVPAITIDDVSYAINGKNLTITVLTSSAVEKLKLKNNQTTIDVFDSEYVTQSSGKKLWTITKPLDYYANKNLTFIPGSNEYGYSDNSYDLFISYDAPSSMGTLEIMSPQANAQHQKNQTLSVSWSAPVTKPDSYTLTVSHNDDVVFTKEIGADATTTVVPGENFAYSGTYYISLSAYKDGYENLNDITEIYIEFDDTPIIPGDDLGTVEYGENPTYRQVYNYICNYVAGWETTTSSPDYLHALFAMVWQESKWEQFELVNGQSVPIIRWNDNGTYDVGITQVNSNSSKFAESEDALKKNWQFNLEFGIGRFNERYWACMTDPIYIAAVEEGMKKTGVSRYEAIARSAYAMYNGGKNLESARRWYTLRDGASENDSIDIKYYKQDNGYIAKYEQKPWERKTGIYVDEEKTTQISKPGVIKIAMDVPVEVRNSADSSSNIIGRFGNGTNVTVLSSKNDYLKVEGRDYETSKTITGYVKAAYVSYDIAPVLVSSDFICTVNKTSMYHGESVTFSVNATNGAKDFTIVYDDVITQDISMNYFGGVYNYEKVMTGTGERNITIFWTEPDGNRVMVRAPTIAVYLNRPHWTGTYTDGVLTIEQTKQVPNDSNTYGLYIKQGDNFKYGAYPIVAAIDEYNQIYERNSNKLLYRVWDNAKNLYLKPGTYEYGIVTKTAQNKVCSHTPIGEFTVEQSDTEDYVKYEARYVGCEYGANVYNKFGTSEPYGEKIWLDYGKRVNYEIGSDIGTNREFVKIHFTDNQGADRVGWISRMSLTTTPAYVHPYPDFEPIWPVLSETKKINSAYYYPGGSIHSSFRALDFHKGDGEGTDIVSIADDGKVIDYRATCTHNVYYKDTKICACGGSFSGNYIIIEYTIGKNKYQVFYHHLKAESIPKEYREIGAKVKNQGTKIGEMGNTGNSSGPHLHMWIKLNGRYIVNPLDVFAFNSNLINSDGSRKFSFSSSTNVLLNNYKNCYFDKNGNWLTSKCGGDCGHNISLNSISLFSLDGSTTDTVNYSIDCYDSIDKFNNLTGTNEGEVSISVPNKTESINVHIPIDETSQFVTIYHAGQGYENNSRFNFDTTTLEFTAIVKDLFGEDEYEFDFVITKESEKETSVNYAMITYYNANDEYVGNDIIDFDNLTEGNAPYSTTYVKFENSAKNTVTLKVATVTDYEMGTWLSSKLSHSFTENSHIFMLSIDDDDAVAYTINRAAKSSDRTLQNIAVEVYNAEREYLASKTYIVEDDVIEIDLPYSTEYIKLYAEATSQFTKAEVVVNGETISTDDLISVSDLSGIHIDVTAENDSSKKYEFDINITEIADITAPVITVVGESGTIYTSGSKITEMVTYSATDESWYDIYLSLNGEELDEMEGISASGNYTITAVDIFRNKSEFSFVYDDGTLPLTNTTFKNTATYHKFYVTFEEAIDNATIYAAVYDKDGKLLGLETSPCDGDDYYIVNVPVNSDTKNAKIFVWEDNIKPLGSAEILNIE